METTEYPSEDEWISRMCDIHTVENHSAIKKEQSTATYDYKGEP